MEVDPKELLEDKERREELELEADRSKLKLNALVAITIALLATFMGVCKIKDENIVLSMGKMQSLSIDRWNYYQAKNIRQAVYEGVRDQLAVAGNGPAKDKSLAYAKQADTQKKEKADIKAEAESYDKNYEALHGRHDQFDLEDAALAISVSLFAITSLTQKRWMYWVALVPTAGGVAMGLAGLFNLNIHPEALMRLFA